MLELCMIFPTRERPRQAAERLHAWVSMATDGATSISSRCAGRLTRVVVGVDDDDPTRHELLRLLAPLFEIAADAGVRVEIAGGTSRNKIHATNRCVPVRRFGDDADTTTGDFDVLIVNSDDMAPLMDGWDAAIARQFAEHLPDLDGAVWCPDGHQDRLMTWPVIGRALYDRLGHVYHPDYETEWADNELHEIASRRGRLVRFDAAPVVEHRHAVWGAAPDDGLYRKNNTPEASGRDRETYRIRETRLFGWMGGGKEGSIGCELSVLIPTTPRRRARLERLVAVLDDDLRRINPRSRRRVEIMIESDAHVDDGGPPIGARRQRLLERARGEYVCFIDDDDYVSAGYLDRALFSARGDPDVLPLDVRAFLGDGAWWDYEHSARHGTGWREAPIGRFLEDRAGRARLRGVRYPNHLNVIRRTIALAQGFATEGDAARHGEDKLFSDGMRAIGALGREADLEIGRLTYYYVPTA